jgi:hypothetical protein
MPFISFTGAGQNMIAKVFRVITIKLFVTRAFLIMELPGTGEPSRAASQGPVVSEPR